MSRTASPVTGKPYGLATVCRVWRLARSGVYRHLAPAPTISLRRRGPTGAMIHAALTAPIRDVLAASPFHGESHRKIWAPAAPCRNAHVVTARAAPDARKRSVGTHPRWSRAGSARPRWHDDPRNSGHDVGDGSDRRLIVSDRSRQGPFHYGYRNFLVSDTIYMKIVSNWRR